MTPPRILITGGSGYLGGWVARLAQDDWAVSATYLGHPPNQSGPDWRWLDLRDPAAISSLLEEVAPAVVVHTAAIHSGSETDLQAVNAAGTRHVAQAARAVGARLVHVSTDALFDGGKGAYIEADAPSPITPYGRSKARAEAEVQEAGGEFAIVRTSLIYGWRPHPCRQTTWMTAELQAGRPLRLFTDQLRCPIWVESLAAAVVELVGLDYRGVLHVAGAQVLSRYEFGTRLLRFHGLDTTAVIPTESRDSGWPLDCTLDVSRARALLRTPLPGVDAVLQAAGQPDAVS